MSITQNKDDINLLSKNYYKFENNLLKLSINTSIDGALIEWNEIYKEKRDEKSGLCICQHKIKNIYFMYNKLTKNTITVGTDCYKKFGFKKNGVIKNPIFYNVIKNILQKGEYEIIEDIVSYVNKIEDLLIKYIKNEYVNIINKHPIKLYKLEELIKNIEDLINEYDIQYLLNIFNEIKEKLNKEQLKKLEKERLEKEQLEKDRLENGRLQKLEKEKLEKERLENGRLQKLEKKNKKTNILTKKYKCICGKEIAFNSIYKHLNSINHIINN